MTQHSVFRQTAAAALWTLLTAIPLTASAQQAHTTVWVNLRAGPGPDYPLVARLAPGTPLQVQGCIDGFTWCDVILPGSERGWMYGNYLAYPYQGADVPVINYGAAIGIPIVAFFIGSYWNDHYRGRPWYRERPRWEHRPPPRPPYHPGPPNFRPPHDRPVPVPRPPGFRPPDRPDRPGHGVVPGRPPGGLPGGRPEVRPPDRRPPYVRPGQARPAEVRPAPGRPAEARPQIQRPQPDRGGGDRGGSRGGGDRQAPR